MKRKKTKDMEDILTEAIEILSPLMEYDPNWTGTGTQIMVPYSWLNTLKNLRGKMEIILLP